MVRVGYGFFYVVLDGYNVVLRLSGVFLEFLGWIQVGLCGFRMVLGIYVVILGGSGGFTWF